MKPYEYLKHLLTEIPKHMDDPDASFLDDLLPWSDAIPDECRKDPRKENTQQSLPSPLAAPTLQAFL